MSEAYTEPLFLSAWRSFVGKIVAVPRFIHKKILLCVGVAVYLA